jgi:muramoyltetrapeptide carboxypeptidase
MEPIKPPSLKKGDTIGIVTPGSALADPTTIERAARYLQGLGYRVKVGKNVGKQVGYLAGEDHERLADLHDMFSDKNVRAVFAARGGYGTPRLLSFLNYRLLARNPKILVGYSDLTALQLALWKKCRLITFHGLMAGVDMAGTMDPFTEELFWETLTSRRKIGSIRFPDEVKVLLGGKAAGRLLGGNLSLVVSLLGTRYQPDFKKAVLFLEEVTEAPYRVDRMLTQLRNVSRVKLASAFLFGQFTDCVPQNSTLPSLTVDEVLVDFASSLARPVLGNLPFGHVPQKMTLPIGLRVAVDATAGIVEYLEPAVS